MKKSFSTRMRKRLEKAVKALCPLIEQQVTAKIRSIWTEYDLRRELVACILGSQVRHEMAASALERLEKAQLLNDSWWSGSRNSFKSKVFDVLSGRKLHVQAKWCYRFPKVRTQQLAKARDAIAERSLSERLFEIYDPKILRQQLVKDISGLGPKQASMFLRNIGRSYDLAIIDTHVLRFMNVKNLLCRKNINISTVKAYERAERIVVNYAEELGYPVGYMDWAIWATMRAANEMGL